MRKGKWYWVGILTILLIFFVFCFALFLLERGKNPRCNDLFDAFRMVLVLFLGEYEEFAPVTTGGKLIITFSFILGVAVVATVIGKIASFFVKLKREVKMPKETGGHIVICNWNDKGDKIVKEIHSPVAEPETEIYIVTDKDDKEIREEELRVSPEYENVYFIKGDPSLHAVLKNSAKAHLAKSIIILADERSPDPDAKTALISLAITRLETEQPQKPHIIAEVINHRKIQHLLDAGVDEWVCATDYGLGIIAQAALYKKISDVYHQLLTYSEETCEIYLIEGPKLPRSLFGKSFKEAAQFLNEKRDEENPAILIGVKREGRIILNPREGDFDIIKEGDGLVVIAYKLPDLRDM
uniref:BK channel n=1 Tax=candidate division WOR-3 bacterium TaxID=2052148 RepID=A0A7C3US81_UNCW3